ncbi:hypothetical protein Bbelb_386930 [Branchiostoma belcheri]|nr:hypothetical protein Bbelb_386930 [Branchiostoma belcheri]
MAEEVDRKIPRWDARPYRLDARISYITRNGQMQTVVNTHSLMLGEDNEVRTVVGGRNANRRQNLTKLKHSADNVGVVVLVRPPDKVIKKIIGPWRDSDLGAGGTWITTHSRQEVFKVITQGDIFAAFDSTLRLVLSINSSPKSNSPHEETMFISDISDLAKRRDNAQIKQNADISRIAAPGEDLSSSKEGNETKRQKWADNIKKWTERTSERPRQSHISRGSGASWGGAHPCRTLTTPENRVPTPRNEGPFTFSISLTMESPVPPLSCKETCKIGDVPETKLFSVHQTAEIDHVKELTGGVPNIDELKATH